MKKTIKNSVILLLGVLVFLPSLALAALGDPCTQSADCGPTEVCGPPTASDGDQTIGECVSATTVGDSTQSEQPSEFSEGLIIPQCQGDAGITENCRDVNLILVQGIKIGRYLFTIIGGVALFFLVLGGYTIILSMGNAEKAKKGYQMAMNAAIGMFIAFAAYLIIYFVLEALGVTEAFRGIQAP